MITENGWILLVGGFVSGLFAGLLGIGGGTILVPILISMGYNYAQAVATSSLAIVMTSLSGSIQNWRMGYVRLEQVIWLGLPGVFTAFLAAHLVNQTPKYILKAAFGFLLLATIYLSQWRKQLAENPQPSNPVPINPTLARIFTGGMAGFLAGLFGIGGGVIMVPMQMWFLKEAIKVAIQTSLGVVVITGISACLGHAREGNVLWLQGIILGIGGLIGAQISTRYLPKLDDKIVQMVFNGFSLVLSGYFFIQAWQDYQN